MNLDSILKPYEDDQPKQVDLSSCNNYIERIPHIVDTSTGRITDEFQSFYNELTKAVLLNDDHLLYELSDKVMKEDTFKTYYQPLKKILSDALNLYDNQKGIDIELNIKRFENNHRNLIGGFFIMLYTLTNDDNDIFLSRSKKVNLKLLQTEVLFTYKRSKFRLISYFQPFTSIDIS